MVELAKTLERVHELLRRRGEPLHAVEIANAVIGENPGARAGEVAFAMLCDEGLVEVENDVYDLEDGRPDAGSVAGACLEGDHPGMAARARAAFGALGLAYDPSLLGQAGYPDAVLTVGARRVAVECWDVSRGDATDAALTLADARRRTYQRLMSVEVGACLLLAERFSASAVQAAYSATPCGLLRCSLLDGLAGFARRFGLPGSEAAEALGAPGLLDVRVEALLEQRRRDVGEAVAVLKVLSAAGRPLNVGELYEGLAERYDIIPPAERLDAVFSRLLSPPLECVTRTGGRWAFLRPMSAGVGR